MRLKKSNLSRQLARETTPDSTAYNMKKGS